MANLDTALVKKNIRQRGVAGGVEETITGILRVVAGQSIATSDLIRICKMGENTRPIRLALMATPVSGTPVLTNPTFSAGVSPDGSVNFKRPDGSEYPPLTESDTALVASLVVPAGLLITSVAVLRPVANSVPNYAPYYATLTPAGAGAFSVAGGDIDLSLSVTFVGEQKANGFVYEEYMNPKVLGE